jgi:ABC-2 type transport system ATP-binding protein
MFETVWATVNFSRELFGFAPDRAQYEKLLQSRAVDKRKDRIMTLSGACAAR